MQITEVEHTVIYQHFKYLQLCVESMPHSEHTVCTCTVCVQTGVETDGFVVTPSAVHTYMTFKNINSGSGNTMLRTKQEELLK